MKYAIVGKTGKEVQTYTDKSKAEAVLAKLKDTGAILKVLAEASPRGVRNKGIVKKYRPSTLAAISAIILKGQENPRYALYARDEMGHTILVAYAPSEETAVFLRRKARGFCRRILLRKFKFKIHALDRTERKIVS